MTTPDSTAMPAPRKRVAALDQFRGYIMAGMFLVNFIGNYAAVHIVFKHNNTFCSYADTIMPGFFFAVGYAFRLTWLARVREGDPKAARRHAIHRNLKLMLIGVLIYNAGNFPDIPKQIEIGLLLPFIINAILCDSFQALVHIAVTSLWVLPVIGRGPRARWGFLAFTSLLHIASLHFFYYRWAHGYAIDGGPLGFVGWAIPTVLGTLVCDAVRANPEPAAQFKRLGVWAAAFMLGGYAISCLNLLDAPGGLGLIAPPFFPSSHPADMWTMDQQVASPSYMLFGGGLCIATYLLFVLVSDVWGFQVGIFRTLGKNPLFGYVIHSVIAAVVASLLLKGDSPLYQILLAFGLYFAIIWATLRFMEYKNWYWRL